MNIEQAFYDVLQDYLDFPVSELDMTLPLKYATDMNSFMLIQLVAALEERFSISISDQDLAEVHSAGDLFACLGRRLADR